MVCKIMKYRYCIVQYAAMISISLVTFCFSIFLCYDAKCLVPIFPNGFSLLILYTDGFYVHIVGIVWQRYVFLFRLPNCFVVFSNIKVYGRGMETEAFWHISMFFPCQMVSRSGKFFSETGEKCLDCGINTYLYLPFSRKMNIFA